MRERKKIAKGSLSCRSSKSGSQAAASYSGEVHPRRERHAPSIHPFISVSSVCLIYVLVLSPPPQCPHRLCWNSVCVSHRPPPPPLGTIYFPPLLSADHGVSLSLSPSSLLSHCMGLSVFDSHYLAATRLLSLSLHFPHCLCVSYVLCVQAVSQCRPSLHFFTLSQTVCSRWLLLLLSLSLSLDCCTKPRLRALLRRAFVRSALVCVCLCKSDHHLAAHPHRCRRQPRVTASTAAAAEAN